MENNKQCPKENNFIKKNIPNVGFVDYSTRKLLYYLTKKLPKEEINTMSKVIEIYYREEIEDLKIMLQDYGNNIDEILAYIDDFDVDLEKCTERIEEEILMAELSSINEDIANLASFKENKLIEEKNTTIKQLKKDLYLEQVEVNKLKKELTFKYFEISELINILQIKEDKIKGLSENSTVSSYSEHRKGTEYESNFNLELELKKERIQKLKTILKKERDTINELREGLRVRDGNIKDLLNKRTSAKKDLKIKNDAIKELLQEIERLKEKDLKTKDDKIEKLSQKIEELKEENLKYKIYTQQLEKERSKSIFPSSSRSNLNHYDYGLRRPSSNSNKGHHNNAQNRYDAFQVERHRHHPQSYETSNQSTSAIYANDAGFWSKESNVPIELIAFILNNLGEYLKYSKTTFMSEFKNHLTNLTYQVCINKLYSNATNHSIQPVLKKYQQQNTKKGLGQYSRACHDIEQLKNYFSNYFDIIERYYQPYQKIDGFEISDWNAVSKLFIEVSKNLALLPDTPTTNNAMLIKTTDEIWKNEQRKNMIFPTYCNGMAVERTIPKNNL